MEIKLWDKGYVKTIEDKLGCKYNEINTNRDSRINAVTAIAAISRGKDKSNNPEKRYQHLLKEAAPNISFYDLENANYDKLEHTAGRPLEFCPVVVRTMSREILEEDGTTYIETRLSLKDKPFYMESEDFINNIGKFGYIETSDNDKSSDMGKLYINARALVNAGIKEEDIPYNKPEELKDYFIAEIKAPYFVFAQLRTHGLLSQVAVSERVVESEEVWLPEDIFDRLEKVDTDLWRMISILPASYNTENINYQLDLAIKEKNPDRLIYIFEILPIDTVQKILKDLGYKKEIYQRWYNHMLYKTWIIGGYLNNPYHWGHFLLEREAYDNLLKSWVQPQTKETAKAIRKLILEYIKERDKNA